MVSRHELLVGRVLGVVARVIVRHPWLIITIGVLLALGGVTSAARRLDLNTHQNALVSNELDYNQRYHRYLEEFGDQEYIYLVIEISDLETAMKVAEAVAEEMEPLLEAGVIESCTHRLPPEVVSRIGLLPLPLETLQRMADFVGQRAESLKSLLGTEDISGLLRAFLAMDPEVAERQPEFARAGLQILQSVITALETTLGGRAEAPASLAMLFESGLTQSLAIDLPGNLLDRFRAQGYIVFDDLMLVLIMPQKNYQSLALISEPLGKVKDTVERVRARFPEVSMGLTGRPVLQADEMDATSADMRRAATLAFSSVLCLFMLFFRNVRRPLLTGLTLALAIGITFGVITFTIGYLNLLSMVFAVLMVSLGTEFGIHFTARYQEELDGGATLEEAVHNAIGTAGVGNITGGVTTAAAFFTVVLTDFKGLAELGFIAGTGVALCMTLMNTLLPAFLLVSDRRWPQKKHAAPVQLGFLGFVHRRPGQTLLAFSILVIAGLPFLLQVRFETNLLELQATGLESVRYEKRLVNTPSINTWFAVSLTDSWEGLQRLERAYSDPSRQDIVGGVDCILRVMPDDQQRRIELIREMGRELELSPRSFSSNGESRSPSDLDVAELSRTLKALLERLDVFLSGTLMGRGEGAEALETLTDAVDRTIEALNSDPRLAAERLGPLQADWATELTHGRRILRDLLNPTEVSLDNLGPFLRNRYQSPESGRFIVYVYPAKNIWEQGNIEEFVHMTHEVDPDVTGVPEQIYQSTRIMFRAFLLAAVYSLVAVFVLVWLDFRSLRLALLSIVPVLIGLLGTFELMPLLGMSFNLANFFSIPIVIGNGINGGVHMLHRYREDPGVAVVTGTTGSAVVLCALTTIIGFGTMLLAEHRGIASLGGVMVLGSVCSLVGSMIVLPAVLRFFGRTPVAPSEEGS